MYLTSVRQRKTWIDERLGPWGLCGSSYRGESAWATSEPAPFTNGGLVVFQRIPVLIDGNPITPTGSWLFTPLRWREDREKKINSLFPDEAQQKLEDQELWDEARKEIRDVMRWGLGMKKTFGGI